MLTSKSRPETQFQIAVNPPPGADPEDVKVIIYDGWDDRINIPEDSGRYNLTLPVGLYTIRWKYADEIGEQVVRLPYNGVFQLNVQRHTAAPVPGAVDSHEYYEQTSAVIRNQTTGSALGELKPGINGNLFLFIRARNQESYEGENLAKDLIVVGTRAQKLFDLAERSQQDDRFGYLACSVPSAPGLYFLEYRGELPRDFPLMIFPNWQTQVYVIHHRGQPLLEVASVSLSRLGMDLSSQTRINAAADAAASALQNNLGPLPQEIERGLLYQKFDNPLLGLLGLHSYLRRLDANANTAQQIFDNLHGLIQNSVDLQALHYKAAMRFKSKPDLQPVKDPPLLRASVEALLEADAGGLGAIAEDSLLENLLPYLSYDSPWATWCQTTGTGIRSALRQANKAAGSPFSFGVSSQAKETTDNWLRNSVLDALQLERKTGRKPDWGEFAISLGVSHRTVSKLLKDLNAN